MESRSRAPKRARTLRLASRSRSVSMRPVRRVTTVALPRSMRTIAFASRNVGIGVSTTTILRTSYFYNATGGAGNGIWTGYLKPGSCFDPCGDTAAIQPQMFDQFAAMYNRYKVNSFSVRIKITGNNSLTNSAWVACGYPAVDPTPLATYQASASQQYAKTTSGGFQHGSPGGTAVGIGTEGKYLSWKLNHNSVVGARSDTWDIGALVTADPTNLQYAVLPLFIQANAAAASTWVLEIDIWQNVTFSQKKNTVDA